MWRVCTVRGLCSDLYHVSYSWLCLQDYNEQVLTQLTIPNVLANLSLWKTTGGGRAGPRYYAGELKRRRGLHIRELVFFEHGLSFLGT